MTTRRSRENILVGILKACASDKLTITRLMATMNLQHTKLTDYLQHLAMADLIEYQTHKGRSVISTTDKGAEAVRSYRNALALLNGYSIHRSTNEGAKQRENPETIRVQHGTLFQSQNPDQEFTALNYTVSSEKSNS